MLELEIEKSTDKMDEEEQVAKLMQELLAGLPDGTATLGVRHDRSGTVFYLTPSNAKSAEFGIHYDGRVDVFFGRCTTFELPYESGLPKGKADFKAYVVVGEIRGACRDWLAVARSARAFSAIRGTVEVDGKPYQHITSSVFHFRLSLPRTLRYAPYRSESADR